MSRPENAQSGRRKALTDDKIRQEQDRILLAEEAFSGLREWLESRAADLSVSPARGRVEWWTQVAQALTPEELGQVITLKELNEERDGLTGILNRRGLERALTDALEWEVRNSQPVTVVFMDLDRFKRLNDTFGHQAGDAVLTQWVRFLRENTRRTDTLGRFGGEEIVAVLQACTEHQGFLLFDRIREDMTQALAKVLVGTGVTVPITMSVGVAQHEPPETVEQLLERADVRMYEAKESGRNLVIAGRSS